jgi:hypothetical protein
MSRFSVSARLGTFVVTGAVCLGVASASLANAATKTVSAKSAGCPATTKISKAAGVKLDSPKVAKKKSTGIVTCTYLNASKGVLIVVEPKLAASLSTTNFSKDMTQTAKKYSATIHKFSKAGKAAAYFEMPKKDELLGRREFFAGVDGKQHLVGIGDNQSSARIIKIARAIN